MVGETSLKTLFKNLSPVLNREIYVFVSLDDRNIPKSIKPLFVFEESEGTTLIVRLSEAESFEWNMQFPCRHITLNVHSSLETVGFMAKITTMLSEHGISVNPVSGFFHDHLFVPVQQADEAIKLLQDLQKYS